MCFSATASFVAGTGLAVLGVATLRATHRRSETAFAAIPLIFGLQQMVEGALWLSFRFDAPQLNWTMTYLFSLFSHVLWPIYMPFAIGFLETVAWRQTVIRGFQGVGLLVGMYLLFQIVKFPVTAVVAENIIYVSHHLYEIPVMLLYLAATCIGCFFSSKPTIRLFGVLALLLFGFAYVFFAVALFSVWCFFAALLSAIIFVHFKLGWGSRLR